MPDATAIDGMAICGNSWAAYATRVDDLEQDVILPTTGDG
jgi:hypothetical protein